MASTLTVPVTVLEDVKEHPNADRLEVAKVLGYQMVVPKGKHKTGDKVVYFPADTMIPRKLAERLGVETILSGSPDDEMLRVKRVKLRGEPSFGLIIPADLWMNIGDNVAKFYGCEKYIPPIKTTAGDIADYDGEIDPFFERYTGIENGLIYTDVLEDGEFVSVTEKIHGSNVKLGYVNGYKVAGSMEHRRKEPEDYTKNTYWYPWSIPEVSQLLDELAKKHKTVLLYGEVYGGSVQSLDYGILKGHGLGFVAFDLCLDGKYVSLDDFEDLTYKIPVAPVLYEGPYSLEKVKELSEGMTILGNEKHIREGVVVKPMYERIDPKIGRVVLKFISPQYELSKHKDKDTTDV